MTTSCNHWPPLIVASSQPMWLRVRDTAITSIAWLTLALLLCREIEFGLASLLRRLGWGALVERLQLAYFDDSLGWAEYLRHLVPYLLVLLMLLMFLCAFGVHTRLMRRRALNAPDPRPLSLVREKMSAGITYEILAISNDDTAEPKNQIGIEPESIVMPNARHRLLSHVRSLRVATIEVTATACYQIAELQPIGSPDCIRVAPNRE